MNSGHTLFFRASANCSKILNATKISNTVKYFRANSVSQGKRKVAQKSRMVQKIYSISWKISGQILFFRASASCSKILNGEKIFNTVYSVYIHLGVIRAIWASVVCNLDKSVTVGTLAHAFWVRVSFLFICAGWLDIIKSTKTLLIYSVSLFNLGGLGAWFGLSPPVATWLFCWLYTKTGPSDVGDVVTPPGPWTTSAPLSRECSPKDLFHHSSLGHSGHMTELT